MAEKTDITLLNGFSEEGPSVPSDLAGHPLVAAGMEILWSGENKKISSAAPSRRYHVGSLRHSPLLRSSLEKGELDGFLRDLTRCYRDIYGGSPWNEYLICTRRKCGKTLGISAAFEEENYVPLSQLEAPVPPVPSELSCPDCSAPLEFFYPPEDFFVQLQRSFREKIIVTLLLNEQGALFGLSLGWETTIRRGWRDKFLRGYGDDQQDVGLSYHEYLEEVREHLGSEIGEESAAFNSAEWAVSVPGRKSGASLQLYFANLLTAFRSMSTTGEDVPVLGHTLLGSKALDIFSEIGFTHGRAAPGSEQVRVYSTLQKLLRGICDLSQRKNQ